MPVSHRIILPLLLLIWRFDAAQGQSTVSGSVRDSLSGEGLPAVEIVSVRSNARALSNREGFFRLQIAHKGADTLRCRMIGYRPKLVPLTLPGSPGGSLLRLEIAMAPDTLVLDSVLVVGERVPLSTLPALGAVAVRPREVQNIGGAFRDAFRSVQALPGVASNNEMSSGLNVRGGSIHENLVLVGGAQVLEPFHLKESPNTGLSIVNLDLLKTLLFMPGGFTARYGDRMSAVVDMEYREGSHDHLAAQLDASLTDGTLTVEGPLSGSLSGLLSGRATYSGYLSHYLVNGDGRSPSFYDLQGILGMDLGEAGHASLNLVHSSDATSGIADGSYATTIASLQNSLDLTPGLHLQSTLSVYDQREDLTYSRTAAAPGIPGRAPGWTRDSSDISQQEVKLQVRSASADPYGLVAGLDAQRYRYDIVRPSLTPLLSGDSLARTSLLDNSFKLGGYVENLIQVTPRLLINAGGRADYSRLSDEMKFSPRFLAYYRFDKGAMIKFATGLYYQTPVYQQLLAASAAGLPPQSMQRATHYLVGIEHSPRSDFRFRVEMYYKLVENLISYARLRSGELVYSPRNNATGIVKGIDFEFTLSDPRVMAWITFSFLVARENHADDLLGARYSPQDQTHTLTAVFEYRVSDRWVLNARSYYGSGFRFLSDGPGGESRLFRLDHYPDYKRIDLRVLYGFPWEQGGARVQAKAFIEIMNLFGNRNVQSFTGGAQSNGMPDVNLLLPRVVNLGVQILFPGGAAP